MGVFRRSVVSDSLWPCGPHTPVSSANGISQARILEWVAISFSRGSSRPRDWACVSCGSSTGRWILYHWHHREASSQAQMAKAEDLFPCTGMYLIQLHLPVGETDTGMMSWGKIPQIFRIRSVLCYFASSVERFGRISVASFHIHSRKTNFSLYLIAMSLCFGVLGISVISFSWKKNHVWLLTSKLLKQNFPNSFHYDSNFIDLKDCRIIDLVLY